MAQWAVGRAAATRQTAIRPWLSLDLRYHCRSATATGHCPLPPEQLHPMPDVRPFRGVRYDIAQVGALSDVVAPPYDVIDAGAAGAALPGQPVQHHPAGAEPRRAGRHARPRIATPGPPGSSEPGCGRASSATDDHPALYLYEQTFEVEGQTPTRKGFLARVRLEPFGQGQIFPHEQTLAGPKADRLALYQATGFNLSPIFGLYPDADNEVLASRRGRPARPDSAGGDRPPGRGQPALGRDRPGRAHGRAGADGRRGRSSSPTATTATRPGCATATSWPSRAAWRARRPGELLHDDAGGHERPGPPDPADAPAGLGLPRPDRRQRWPDGSSPSSRSGTSGQGEAGCRAAWDAIEDGGDQDLLGFGTVADGHWLLARLRSDEAMDRLAPTTAPTGGPWA